MWYGSKKEILEHLGKNGNSVRSLDILIEKGLVIEKDGRYISRNDVIRGNLSKSKEKVLELEGVIDKILNSYWEYYSKNGGVIKDKGDFKRYSYSKLGYSPSKEYMKSRGESVGDIKEKDSNIYGERSGGIKVANDWKADRG